MNSPRLKRGRVGQVYLSSFSSRSSGVATLLHPFVHVKTISELKATAKSLQGSKSPGPKGFPAEFYKTF